MNRDVDWLNTDNTVAAIAMTLGLVASAAVVWNGRRIPRPRRVPDGTLTAGSDTVTGSDEVDDTPPPFSRAARTVTILLTLCVTALACIVILGDRDAPPIGCVTGELTVIGSTAFAPAIQDTAARYESDCPDAQIMVEAHGSNDGLWTLMETAESTTHPPAMIAIYDGDRSDLAPHLRGDRVAVATFAVVVNDRVSVADLTTEQLRSIYQGDVINWNQLDGPDLPILVVSRNANSGTRDLFRRRVLGGTGEPPYTSQDCENRNVPRGSILRCELDSTAQLLTTVANLPGAIGYSELNTAVTVEGLHTVNLDGQEPTVEATYPLTEIEYAYTRGEPPADSLTTSFLSYLTRSGGQIVVEAHGHLPCYSPKGFSRCRE